MSCTVYLATEAATPLNSPAVGDRLWLGGTNFDDAKYRRWSPLDQVWQPCMVLGDHPWLPHLVHGDRLWETIDSVTGHRTLYGHMKKIKLYEKILGFYTEQYWSFSFCK